MSGRSFCSPLQVDSAKTMSQVRTCSECGAEGHYSSTCTTLKDLKDALPKKDTKDNYFACTDEDPKDDTAGCNIST